MKKIAIVALSAAMGFGVMATAQAQFTEPVGLSVRGGIFFPNNREARDAGNTWFGFGAEYQIDSLNLGLTDDMSATYSISLDYLTKGDFQSIPLLLNYVGRNDQFFYSAGLGVNFVRVPVTVGTGTRSRTELGYQIGVGYDFNTGQTPIFIEAKYFGSADSRLNGFGVFAGVRF